MELSTKASSLPFVGPVFARRLAHLGLNTLEDILYHFPHRYEDFRNLSKISEINVGTISTVRGKITEIKNEYTKGKKVIQRAIIEDATGKLEIIWFNQRFLPKVIPTGTHVSVSGRVEASGKHLTMISPEYEKLSRDAGEKTIHTGRLVPIYPEISRISSKWIRARISQLLPNTELEEFLPKEVIENFDLPELKDALNQIHFPENLEHAEKARKRFGFEELFMLHLSSLERKKSWTKQHVCWKIKIPSQKVEQFISGIPFTLTQAQKRSITELVSGLVQTRPMNRLLEGDVGSGKTVVAATGALIVAENGYQTAVMAPTQILAAQHYNTLKKLLEPYGIEIQLITGSLKSSIINHKSLIFVGTHALLHNKKLFDKLAFVVIDEQHKFGVEQRAKLLAGEEQKCTPHTLTITATPIPRTIALTLYGDLDLSVLDEMPPGRQKITTWLVPPQKREGAYNWTREQIKNGSQAFIVCPLIEQSEVESMKQVRAATVEFNRLSKGVFTNLTLGLLHGRMKGQEKEKEIDKFRNKEIDILVSTPVVEVGIDIPNATIMMVEGADRFGLAQLHQLRGRVGRGEKKSYCLLFTESPSEKVWSRLKAMEETKTGSELAELDLRLRGPGEIFGTKQHGFPELKVASFSDVVLIHKTRDAAETIFPKLNRYPKLAIRLKTHLIAPN